MATARPTGNLFDIIESHSKDIRKLKAKLRTSGSAVSDHGALTGLGDDDHTQYHTDARALAWHQGLADAEHPYVDESGDTMTGALQLPDGSAGSPSLTFSADTDTGIYRESANEVGIAVFGSNKVRIGDSYVIVLDGTLNDNDPRINANGSASSPAYSFRGDLDTGIFREGANSLGFAMGGNAFNIRWDGSFFWFEDDSGAGNRFVFDHVNEIRAAAGSAGDPSYTFQDDNNSGIYSRGADQVGISAGGNSIAWFSNSGGRPEFNLGESGDTSEIMLNGTRRFLVGGTGHINVYTSDGGTSGLRLSNNTGGPFLEVAFRGAGQVGQRFWESSMSGRRYEFRRSSSFGIFEFYGVTSGGTSTLSWAVPDNGQIQLVESYNVTTGASANVHIESDGRIVRSTSSLKYKPNWQYADEDELANLELPNSIVWTELREHPVTGKVNQDIYLGFGTEHVYDMLPAATQNFNDGGTPEMYDLRSLVAILSAKVKRLERNIKLGS